MLIRDGGARWLVAWMTAVLIVAGILWKGAATGAVAWAWAIALGGSLLSAGLAALASVVGDRAKAAPHRAVTAVACGSWTAYITVAGWSPTALIVFGIGAAVVGVLEKWLAPAEWMIRTAQQPLTGEVLPAAGPPTAREAFWANVLQRALKQPVPVLQVIPWDKQDDGEQIVIELPDDKTLDTVAHACPTIAARAKLLPGCTIRALPGAHQGLVILDAMKRDCLLDESWVKEETTRSSIYEPVPLARTPRGEYVEATLREKSMMVGGMPGAGKTTFLHRLVMRMARWSDSLIWVADLNGGGLAWPWVEAWARGDAPKPTVDWVATNAYEAAVMVAAAQAIAKDRKINPEARRRKKDADNDVLPVDEKLPAIIIITDEGAEFSQSTALIVRLAKEGITSTAQIARAEGIRVVMSILRGTSDTLDRALKSAMGVMTCLRMNMQAEYGHILETNPRYTGPMHNGSMFIRLPEQGEQVIHTKTERVSLSMIDRHSIATAHLRPDMDDRAQKVAARLTVREVLDDKDPRDLPDIARHPVMRDVEAGRAYSGRWDRQAHKLAELRGEEVPEFADEPEQMHVPDRPTAAEPGSMAERFLLEARQFSRHREPEQVAESPASAAPAAPVVPAQREREVGPMDVFARPAPAPAVPGTDLVPVATHDGVQTSVRELIRMVLRQAGDEWLTDAEIRHRIRDETGIEVGRSRSGQVLGTLRDQGEVERDDSGTKGPYYRLRVSG
ncbi:hypothetical protein C1I95_14850 [Micromonospora craterilacus]|uniref:FtsK domain-containing protein n=1 Tax=Micromonospora craterilacus TaxID=1655439 RepID=A0A2W2FS37_9ACTN|nr:hypothetical protein C1I95_14850 [Micromonospora craterilacus]